MRMFKLNDKYSVVCETKDTSSGFKHEAVIFVNKHELGKTSIKYYNRTWESFTYESALKKVLGCYIEDEKEKQDLLDIISHLR